MHTVIAFKYAINDVTSHCITFSALLQDVCWLVNTMPLAVIILTRSMTAIQQPVSQASLPRALLMSQKLAAFLMESVNV